jgi:hypothetical protein
MQKYVISQKQDMTQLEKAEQFFNDTIFNLSGIGNLQKNEVDFDKIVCTSKRILGGKGTIYPTRSGGTCANLKKGGRTALKRHTLTQLAKTSIRDAGFVLAWKVENDISFNSTLMITLTYGRNVPDHKTAKKHLDLFFQNCRNRNWLRYYVWVAQLQTGKRAKEKGIESYRAKNGDAIHFHILTITEKGNSLQLHNAQRELRAIWKKIVNKWEVKCNHKPQNIGGVDIRSVYNSANYISRYISNESETIIGNMWNISDALRKATKPQTKTFVISKSVFDTFARSVYIGNVYRTDATGKKVKIKDATFKTISVKNWDKSLIVCSDNVDAVERDLMRRERNLKKVNQAVFLTSD